MSAAILRSAALCIRGNLFLKDGTWIDIDPHFDELFGFSGLHFFGMKSADPDKEDLLLATSSKQWLEQVQASGITSLRLNHEMRNHPTIHDYAMAWSVDADKAWTVVSGNPGEENYGYWGDQSYLNKGKRVRLLGFAPGDLLMPRSSPEACAQTLKDVLAQGVAFCKTHAISPYGTIFAETIGMIDGDSTKTFLMQDRDKNYFALAAPTDLMPDLHINLLKVFELYNIFGGMGSWNDIPLPDDESVRDAYHILSKELHKALVEAMVSVANAGLPE